uniref:Uncharacterized protein n=1 Tax=Nelumbo nucifera TaxID=4432 RepID=A0A822ZJK9_NELNU|nr:TPA_asm: hypothetical protein HUJ06_001835 [Nelumbo nucifera]
MHTYSIILGRNRKKSTVDVNLASLGSGMNISLSHIFYDFSKSNPPVKLDSQDLLQIGDKKFYLLLLFATSLVDALPVTSLTLLHPFCLPLHISPLHGLRCLHRRITLPRHTVVAGASKKLRRRGHEIKKSETKSRATVLSDLCGSGEWMPMAKLHFFELDWPVNESKGRPWFGLEEYPNHFVINTWSKGCVTLEFALRKSLLFKKRKNCK